MTITVSPNNGTAPATALAGLPGSNGDGSGHAAPHTTAQSYARIREGMRGAGLGDLVPSDGWSCYRDRAAQQHMRDIGLTTIPVGQSIHGEWTHGSAVDFSGLGGFGAPRHEWLRHNGPQFGWYQPSWAQAGGSLPEPWHWEYDQRNDAHLGEEEMPTAQEIADAVWGYELHRSNGPVTDAGTYLVDTRVLAGPTTGPLVRTADQVWFTNVARANGPVTDAGTYLVDTRASVAPVNAGPTLVSDQVWDNVPDSVVTSRSYNLAVFAMVVLVAVVGGVAVGLLADTTTGVIAGVAALIGGLLAVLLRNLPGGAGR